MDHFSIIAAARADRKPRDRSETIRQIAHFSKSSLSHSRSDYVEAIKERKCVRERTGGWILLNLLTVMKFSLSALFAARASAMLAACLFGQWANAANLQIVAKTGDQGITTIRSGLSINNQGTIAFGAMTAGGRSTVFSATSDGLVRDLRPGNGLVNGYGVQVNDNNDVAFLVGPGISGSDYCIPNPDPTDPGRQCLDTLSQSVILYSVLSVNALAPQAPRVLAYSLLLQSFDPSLAHTANGPFTSIGPAFSLNNQGQVAFLTDTSLNRQITDYRLATSYENTNWHLFPPDLSIDPTAYPLLANNGRIVLKTSLDITRPLLVLDTPALSQTILAKTNDGFQWIGSYPGITPEGDRVAFVASVTTNHPTLPSGDGLFLSTFINGQWNTRLVLGTSYGGTNLFSKFHSYYRTCVAELATQTNSVKICFGAASPTGRVGLYSVVYDYAHDTVSSLEMLIEAGRDVAGLGSPTSFELFDSVNNSGEVALWVQSAQTDAVIRVGTQIEAIDPVPLLVLTNGTITTDYEILAAATNTVQGFIADGVTRILLHVQTPGDGDVTFRTRDDLGSPLEAGLLSAVDSPNEASQVITHTIQLRDGRFMAFAVLRSPRDFVRLFENDETLTFRRLAVDADFAPQGHLYSPLARRQLRLYRPPVVLMHGIWGDANTTWQWLRSRWLLLSDSRFFVYKHDYSAESPNGLDNNVGQARAAVEIATFMIRTNYSIAAVQADVVAHSMGGLLARLYIAAGNPDPRADGLRYLRNINYQKGDIHKLVTVDTPHRGSEVCDLLIAPNGVQYPGAILAWGLGCVTCGSIGDMRTFSDIINNLAAAPVPAHAIVGIGGSQIVSSLKQILGVLKAKQIPGSDLPRLPIRPYLANASLVSALLTVIDISQQLTFGSHEHDLIVSDFSQQGGISTNHVSYFNLDLLNFDLGIHVSTPGESRVGQKIVELLNAPITDVEFETAGFPAHSTLGPEVMLARSGRLAPANVPASAPLFVQGLSFQLLSAGTNVLAGTNVTITLVSSNGFQPAKVMVIGQFGAESTDAPPFQLTFTVPPYWLGPLSVKGFGVDTNGLFAESEELILNVTTTATLTNVSIRPETIYLFDYAQKKQVDVFGQFSDGVERKLAATDQQFITIDPSIATVTINGLIEAQRTGQTTLLVRNGALSASASVLVLGASFTNSSPHSSQHLEIIELGTNVVGVTDINNAGQVLIQLPAPGLGNTTSAIWENGLITPLAIPPGSDHVVGNALSESGVVSGFASGLAVLWLSPTNFVYVTNPDGSIFSGPNGAGVMGVHDSDAGLIGLAGLGGGPGIGRPPPGTYFRLSGTQVVLPPIVAQGVPVGYEWTPGQRLNRNGILIGHIDRFDGEATESSLPATLDSSNQIAILEGGNGGAVGINESGDVAGGLGTTGAVLWHNAKPTIVWTGEGARATAINNRGHVAVTRGPSNSGGSGAAIWANGKVVRLGELFDPDSDWKDNFGEIVALNDNGWLICTANYKYERGPNVLIKLGPAIRQQPISRTKVPGQSVAFSAFSYGIADIGYQWRKDGTNLINAPRISGADTPQLTISQLQTSDAGNYDLVVTDIYGTATSSNAVLTVLAEGCLRPGDGLVAQWSGDGNSQEMLNRYTATLMNGTSFSNGIVNSAFAFDGANDYVKTDLDVSPSAMPITTWEAWIFPTRTNYVDWQTIFDDLKDSRVLYIQDGTRFVVSGAGGGLPEVSLNQWQHIALIFYPGGIEFYKDSQRFSTWYAPSPGDPSFRSLLTMGSRLDGTLQYQGLIDEVSIYNRALSQEEVKAIYDVGYAGKCRPAAQPRISSQPPSLTAYGGSDVTFPTTVQGAAPLIYQWYFNRTNILANATNASLTLGKVQSSNTGGYTVVVSNEFGVVTSVVANLVVRPACENQWTRVSSAPTFNLPPVKATAFDSSRGVVVFWYSGQTWEWNGTNWRLAATTGPATRDSTKMVYDSGRKVTVLFGGSVPMGNLGGVLVNDTWEWDGKSWTLQASSGPAPRSEHAMAYDSRRGVTVLFGGLTLNDTWEWDGIAWLQVTPTGPGCASPSGRRAHEMVYDSQRQKVILFGGALADGSSVANDTWEWDGACWQEIHPIQSPPRRYYFSMAYDFDRNSVILYGGSNGRVLLDDTWELIGDLWIQMSIQGARPSSSSRMAYDSTRNAVVLASETDVWELSTPQIPIFQEQPLSQTRFLRESASLSVCATGQGILAYQWFVNGTNAVLNATSPTLDFDSVQAAQAGGYSVVVSNSFGSVTSVVARLSVTPCQTTPVGLISWWRAGENGLDSSSTNNAVPTDGLGFGNGEVMQAFTFNGIDQHLKVNASTNLNLRAAQGITIEGWVNPSDLAPRPLLEWNRGSNDDPSIGVHFWTSAPDGSGAAGSLFADIRDTAHADHILSSSANILTRNSFQHVALTYDRPIGVLTLYHNGVLVAQKTVGTFANDTAGDLYLGYRPGTTNVFAGLMDEISIYNRALTSNEIASVYLAASAGKCLQPDGTPYVYLNGVNYPTNTVALAVSTPVQISMLSTFNGGTIRFTLDGSPPTNGVLYSGPFGISKSTTINSIAFDSSGSASQAISLTIELLPVAEPGNNRIQLVSVATDKVTMTLLGTIGRSYTLQRSVDLVGWSAIATGVAGANGTVDLIDASPPKDKAFYRTISE